jgi:multicomponent Na+:H+ antiporter subunit E
MAFAAAKPIHRGVEPAGGRNHQHSARRSSLISMTGLLHFRWNVVGLHCGQRKAGRSTVFAEKSIDLCAARDCGVSVPDRCQRSPAPQKFSGTHDKGRWNRLWHGRWEAEGDPITSALLAVAGKAVSTLEGSRLLLTIPANHASNLLMRKIVLFGLLFGFWLALSGHYSPFLIASGVAASLIAVAATVRMGTDDDEAMPLAVFAGIPRYYPWLIMEIAKSAWNVSMIIVHPRLPISPAMTTVHASQKTSTGVATYANSITLTPGTVTTGVRDRQLTVYALTREGALGVEAGDMDQRVRRFEGGR